MTLLSPFVLSLAVAMAPSAAPAPTTAAPGMDTVQHLGEFGVVELRRYTTAEGARTQFARYFEAYFPEAFEQLGAIVFGQFLERDKPNGFTWLRGYKDMAARAIVCANFYYGPLWKEHRAKVNAILPDSDNVLLLRPLHPQQGVLLLPAVDPLADAQGAQGIVVAQVFAPVAGKEEAVAQRAEAMFATYPHEGVRAAGVLVTLDAPNNFPQLPVRSDGSYLVWLGVVKDEATLTQRLKPALAAAAHQLHDGGELRAEPETIVMDPTPRSRLRWLGH
jgi:hypothetical protein